MTNPIILSKGIYQLIKNHLKQKNQLSDFNKKKLEMEIKSAKIVPGKEMPEDVVSINTNVQVRDIETENEFAFDLVSPGEAKVKNNKFSALSDIGLALIGYRVGEEVHWEMPDGLKRFRIEQVSLMK
ncbi:MAG: GreA/GreB family elongation factor [Sphingobacteriaceae bacterium]